MLVSCTEYSSENSTPQIPYNEELSSVEGVSIVRKEASGGHGYNSYFGNEKADIDSHDISLLTCLGAVTETLEPIVLKEDLPEGQYDIVAGVESGGRRALTRRICQAFSEAFELNVTRKMIELDAIVLSCPDRQTISMETGTEEMGFWRHDELADNVRRTHFSSTADNIAQIAGYLTRSLAKTNELPDRKARLKQVFVNETGIEGFFKGSFVWDPQNPERIKSSLRELGFTLTTAKRNVPAIVVESGIEGEKWSYLSDSEIEQAGSEQ